MIFQWKTILFTSVSIMLSMQSLSPAYAAGQWEARDEHWLWQREDGSYSTETWEKINNKWYYFNSDGYMRTGWFFDSSSQTWYRLDDSGAMAKGEQWDGGYLDFSGAWVSEKIPPLNSFVSTEEDDAYWQQKWQKYGLPDFSARGTRTYVLTYTYDPASTVLPDLYNAVYAKAAYTFNGFNASWSMSSQGRLTFTVTDFNLY